MQWDETISTGSRAGYGWLVLNRELGSLPRMIVEAHPGLRLCITSFDSGTIRPSQEEIAAGWTLQGEVMVSPPLDPALPIPYDQYDEWYLMQAPSFEGLEFEVFVNFVDFTLEGTEKLLRNLGSSPDRRQRFDMLIALQEKFWEQLVCLSPVSYVAMGMRDIVVSRKPDLIARIIEVERRAAQQAEESDSD